MGVATPFVRRAIPEPRKLRQGASQAPGASRRSILFQNGNRERAAPRPLISRGGGALATFTPHGRVLICVTVFPGRSAARSVAKWCAADPGPSHTRSLRRSRISGASLRAAPLIRETSLAIKQEPLMPAEKFDFRNAQGHTLAALLDRPDGPIRAVALFAHCFTCGKDNRAARRIAEGLKLHGIAVLRFDFTGLGASEGEFANTTFSSNVDDLVAAADHLRTDVDGARDPDRPQPRRRRGARRRASHRRGARRGDDRCAVRSGACHWAARRARRRHRRRRARSR